MQKFVTLNKEDINNPLHPNLWDDILEQLGVKEDAEAIDITLSKLDINEKNDTPAGYRKIRLKDIHQYGTEHGIDEMFFRTDDGSYMRVVDYKSNLCKIFTHNMEINTNPETFVYVR